MTTRMLPQNSEFLDDWVVAMSPYGVTESGLINLCIAIVRSLYDSGQLNLSPTNLRNLLQRAKYLDGIDPRRDRLAKLFADAAKFRMARPD